MNIRKYFYSLIASEISTVTRYYNRVIQWQPRKEDSGFLLAQIECSCKEVIHDEVLPPLDEAKQRTGILLNGNLNHSLDIEALLKSMRSSLASTSRILVVAYNPYLRAIFALANVVGMRRGAIPTTFLTQTALANLVKLAGFEIVRSRPAAYCPVRLLGIGTLLNRILPAVPVLRAFAFTQVIMLRPLLPRSQPRPSLSVVIPARNERGNIQNALDRLPDLRTEMEIIFVEGNSSDGTWEEIERAIRDYRGPHNLAAFQQTGKGKGDAVRLGFSKATGDLVTILDADLTMPPELLSRFYDTYCSGLGDFVNGSRLIYPMEGEAMRFLNHLGNVFFAKSLSHVLDTPLSDSLCGTKLLARHDYLRMVEWRKDFGDFDPFGDFELLFPAAILGLGIVDVPVRYRARTYGTTNIHRFRHGMLLLRMTLTGLFRIKAPRLRIGSVARNAKHA